MNTSKEVAREIVNAPGWFEGEERSYVLHPDMLERIITETVAARDAEHAAELARVAKERDEARDWVRRMHRDTQVLTCAFCGEAYPPGTPTSGSEALTAHVLACAKHPMRKVERERDELLTAIGGCGGEGCCYTGKLDVNGTELLTSCECLACQPEKCLAKYEARDVVSLVRDLETARDASITEAARFRERVRWSVETTEDGVRLCRGEHEKSEGCRWIEYVEKARAEKAEASKDAAYSERDRLVAAFATLAKALGWPVWLATHVGEWEDAWRNIVYFQTPYGQMSWHYHDSERPWFSSIAFDSPPAEWDGHSTGTKYERLRGLVHDGVVSPDFLAFAAAHFAWAADVAGPGPMTKRLVDHIRKELAEIEADPTDGEEWLDVVMLALNGAMRVGLSPVGVMEQLRAKLAKNKARTWLDWRTADPDAPMEHVR